MVGSARPRPRPTHYLSGDGRVVRAKKRSLIRRLLRLLVILACLGAVAGGAMAGVVLTQIGRAPREWAPYLQRRALTHPPLIVDSVDLVAWWLIHADRLAHAEPFKLPASLGASPDRSGPTPDGRLRLVSSSPALAEAAADAKPGDVIQLAPGHYRFAGSSIKFNQPGTAIAPITVRAARLDDVVIESDVVETFHVAAPFWRFENLSMRGVCGDHSGCEHAIHVVAGATDVVIRNNRFEDYNAHLKINGEDGRFPDRGVVEGNTFTNSAPRSTGNPVTPIDLVAASDWHIRTNIIADFVRAGEGAATYGAFVKGAGEGNVMERNLVVCEWKLRGIPGQQVGLSLGGGGTDLYARREAGRTGFEQVGGHLPEPRRSIGDRPQHLARHRGYRRQVCGNLGHGDREHRGWRGSRAGRGLAEGLRQRGAIPAELVRRLAPAARPFHGARRTRPDMAEGTGSSARR
jgi:hypothetical protein